MSLSTALSFIDEPSPFLESVYAHFDNDLMRLVIWANQANATPFAQIAPLIRQAAGEIDRLGLALTAQSLNKNLPCSLAQFIETWLGNSLRSRLTPCDSDSVSGALLMIRKAVRDQPLAETRSK
jgi:N-acetylglucosamine kinase-like BadF-type ATPase